MINNRQGGRRRGRGGQRGQNPGGQPGNRQDNRQRGNAAQLLEKYKSMARDAQLAGDRVQTEYYLQFADHYFRVLGESRARFDDQRRQQGDFEDESDEDMAEADSEQQDEQEEARRPSRDNRDRADRADRTDRDDRPERGERRRRYNRDDGANGAGRREAEEERIPLDALPPAIGREEAGDSAEEAPRPRRRVRRPTAEDGEGEVAPAA